MKIRVRNCKITKSLDVDENCKLEDLYQFVYGLFNNALPSEFYLSLNGTDPIENKQEKSENKQNNDVTLKDCDIVGGDLVHIVSLDPAGQNPDEDESVQGGQKDTNVDMETEQVCSQVSKSDENAQTSSKVLSSNDDEINEEHMPSTSGMYTADGVPMEEDPVDHSVVSKCLSEPQLCRDCIQGTVPPLLAKVYQDSEVETTQDALVVALHILMLESGYISVEPPDFGGQSSDLMSKGWRSAGSYKLKYTHNSCSETDVFTIVCVPMNKLLIVHGISPEKEEEKLKLTMVTSDYIQSVQCEINNVYRNLSRLSMLFKDAISLPMLQTFRQNKGYPVLNGMMALSLEIQITILSYLDITSTVKVSQVNKEFNQVARDRYLWRRHYLRHFGNRQNNEFTQDWYTLFKNEYRIRKQREKERRRYLSQMTHIVPPVFRPPPDPGYPAPLPLYPPGMIGGDFDLFPQFQGPNIRRGGPNPLQPLQPRFDPLGPLPDQRFRPGRGGGMRDNRNMFGRMGGPRFF